MKMIAVAPHHWFVQPLLALYITFGVGYCFIHAKAMREAILQDKAVSSHTLFYPLSSGNCEGKEHFTMKKVVFLALAMSIVLLSSCESKFSKLTNNAAKDAREYIDAFNNAKSAEEVRAIERDWKERGKYYDREFEKINNETSIKEKQRVMQNEKYNGLGDEVKNARRNARDRFK